jgi:hypothetical protein
MTEGATAKRIIKSYFVPILASRDWPCTRGNRSCGSTAGNFCVEHEEFVPMNKGIQSSGGRGARLATSSPSVSLFSIKCGSLECSIILWQPRMLGWEKKTPWSESASELYRQSDRRLSAKWLQTFADKGCHVISVTDPYGRILGFLDRSRYFSIM